MHAWHDYKPVVTVVDVLEMGACIDGVRDFIASAGGIIAASPTAYPDNSYIQKAANASGDGDGDGDGDGYGDGYGDGDGYGYGYG